MARRKRILWSATSGFSEAARSPMMPRTMSLAVKGEMSSSSASLPSEPMTFLGFFPFLPAGVGKTGNRNSMFPVRNDP